MCLDYRRTSTLDAEGNTRIGRQGTGELTVADGGRMWVNNLLSIGNTSTGVGTALVTGAGSTVSVTDNIRMAVGEAGTGTLEIADAAGVRVNASTVIGEAGTSTGTVSVHGQGSLLRMGEELIVGDEGTGSLDLGSGARVAADSDGFVARAAGSTGTVSISGDQPAVLEVDGGFFVGGGDDNNPGGDASVSVMDGGTIWTEGHVQIYVGSEVTLDGGTLRLATMDNDGTFSYESGTVRIIGDRDNADGLITDLYGPAPTIETGATMHLEGELDLNEPVTVNEGGALAFDVDVENASNARLITDEDVTLAEGGRVELHQSDTTYVEHGQSFMVIDTDQSIDDLGVQIDSVIPRLTFEHELLDGSEQLHVKASRDVFTPAAEGANQQALAEALNVLNREQPDVDAAQLLDTVDGICVNEDQDTYNEALNELTPLAHESIAPINAQTADAYHARLASRFASQRAGLGEALALASNGNPPFRGLLASAAGDPRLLAQAVKAQHRGPEQEANPETHHAWNAFGQVTGVFQDQDPDDDRTGYRSNAVGAQLGVDHQFSDQWSLGLGGGYMFSEVDFSQRRGEMDVHSARLGPYAGFAQGPWFADGSLTYGYHRIKTDRGIPSLNETASSERDAHDLTLGLAGGYDFELDGGWTLTPLASVQYVYLHEERYSEDEAGGAELEVGSRDTHSLRTRLGGSASVMLEAGGMTFVPEASLAWERESLADDNDIDARFAVGGGSFTIEPGTPDRDRVSFGAGVTGLFNERTSAHLNYDGLVSSDGETHAVTGGLGLRF